MLAHIVCCGSRKVFTCGVHKKMNTILSWKDIMKIFVMKFM